MFCNVKVGVHFTKFLLSDDNSLLSSLLGNSLILSKSHFHYPFLRFIIINSFFALFHSTLYLSALYILYCN